MCLKNNPTVLDPLQPASPPRPSPHHHVPMRHQIPHAVHAVVVHLHRPLALLPAGPQVPHVPVHLFLGARRQLCVLNAPAPVQNKARPPSSTPPTTTSLRRSPDSPGTYSSRHDLQSQPPPPSVFLPCFRYRARFHLLHWHTQRPLHPK